MAYRYFKESEIQGLNNELVAKLDTARHVAGVPFVIKSGKRSEGENEQAGGVEDSSHVAGLAVDIRLGQWVEGYPRNHARFCMMKGLMAAKFDRIILYSAHIHVDVDQSKPQETMPLGGESH